MNANYNDTFDVVVIGGGPAGLMCAYQAASGGHRVAVLDGNRQPGRKLRITGKGRCNLTNNCEIKEFMTNIPGNGKFLYSSLNRFPPSSVIEFFETHGLQTKVERGNRVFPVSDNANDVAELLVRLCRDEGVDFFRTRADRIDTDYDGVCSVHTQNGGIPCRAAVLCTGGKSYPLTGSDGTGYMIAKHLGHTIVTPKPSLVPLESDDAYCSDLQGFSLKNVCLRAYEDNTLIYSETGEMLFTHFGVSGPLVLSASAHMRDFENRKYRLEIDLKTALDDEQLDAKILRVFAENSNKTLRNVLPVLIGRSLAPVILELSGADGDIPVHSVTHYDRAAIRRFMKAFPVSVKSTRPIDEAIVTSGGVSTKEVNPRTMESKFVPGLYFAGEVLDLDAYTGGFNLQIAWSTGYVAGCSV